MNQPSPVERRQPVVAGELLLSRLVLASKCVCPVCSYPRGYHTADCVVVMGRTVPPGSRAAIPPIARAAMVHASAVDGSSKETIPAR